MSVLQVKFLIVAILLAVGGATAILLAVGGLSHSSTPDWVSEDTAAHSGASTPAHAQPPSLPQVSLTTFPRDNNKTDQTAWIQNALDQASKKHEVLHIPRAAKPYSVRPLQIPSHTRLVLESGVVLQTAAGYTEFQRLINLVDVQDVEITGYGATLRMNKDEYKNGEYRHCVYISGSTGVDVRGITCLEPGGDGFYVSGSDKKRFSENVTLEGVSADGSTRNGLTIISAKNMIVRHSRFLRSAGVKPDSGIDLEPESPSDHLDDVLLEDNVTEQNAGQGIRVAVSKLTLHSHPVQVLISGHRDRDSGGSGLFATNETKGLRGASGTITIEHFSSESPRLYGILFSFWNSTGPRAFVTDAQILNANQSHSTDDNAAIGITRGGGGSGYLGNIEFVHTSVRDIEKTPLIDYYFSFNDYSRKGFSKIAFSQPGVLSGATHQHPLGMIQGQPVETLDLADSNALLELWKRSQEAAKTKKNLRALSSRLSPNSICSALVKVGQPWDLVCPEN